MAGGEVVMGKQTNIPHLDASAQQAQVRHVAGDFL